MDQRGTKPGFASDIVALTDQGLIQAMKECKNENALKPKQQPRYVVLLREKIKKSWDSTCAEVVPLQNLCFD